MQSAIANIRSKWVVQVVFDTGAKAAEFKARLEKVKENPAPLYYSTMASALREAEAIELTKENRAP